MEDMNDNNKGGRPTKYKAEFTETAFNLCLLGVTDAQLATCFEVNEDTLYEWKKAYPEFAEAIRKGKLEADGQVAAALFKRAIGFTYQEITFEKIGTEDLKDEDPAKTAIDLYRKKVVVKTVVPDTGAAMNWLKNRQKLLWRDSLEIDFNKLTDEQLDEIINRLIQAQQNNNQ